MSVSAIDRNPATYAATQRGLSSLNSDDFFKLMVSELRNQDPLEPSKTSDMIGQVSQLRSIELDGKLSETLDTLSRQQRTSGMADLMGKYVLASMVDEQGVETTREGVVTAVRFDTDGSAILELDTGDAVPATAVTAITTIENLGKPAAEAAAVTAKNRGDGGAAHAGSQDVNAAAAQSARAANRKDPPWYTLGGLLKL